MLIHHTVTAYRDVQHSLNVHVHEGNQDPSDRTLLDLAHGRYVRSVARCSSDRRLEPFDRAAQGIQLFFFMDALLGSSKSDCPESQVLIRPGTEQSHCMRFTYQSPTSRTK